MSVKTKNLPLVSIDVSYDGTTVWVNDVHGCIGRFSKKFGLDVHRTVQEQADGAPQCLYCTHEAGNEVDWNIFVDKMLLFHNVVVPPNLISF
jgi:2-hydroxy-3-keto-5-methylthiopentenyl-1-phosphate phosphatase